MGSRSTPASCKSPGNWYVTHTGLLRLARRKHCRGIHVEAVESLCDSASGRYVLKATVYPSKNSSGFVGYGDADPTNVSALVRGAEMRIAETRAVNRALAQGLRHRHLLGRGNRSVLVPMPPPELTKSSAQRRQRQWKRQWFRSQGPRPAVPDHPPAQARCRTGQGLRSRLLRHQSLKDATREQVESFVQHLADSARRTAMPWSASSTATPARARRWWHETSASRSLRDRAGIASRGSRRHLSRAARDAQHRWHAQKPFYVLRLSVLEPKPFAGRSIVGRLYCTPKAMWKLGWFLRDFLYDPELLTRDEIDEHALRGLVGVVKISHTVVNGVSLVNFDGFAPASQWEELSTSVRIPPTGNGKRARGKKGCRVMNYSYTQISQFLTCPRRYRYRYLDGWQEKDVRAAMLFGRAFEQAVAALFRGEDPGGCLVRAVGAGKRPEAGLLRHTTPGTACCSRACSCWSASSRTVGSRFASHRVSSRSSSPEACPPATALWLTSMPSASWTARPACWSGRPPPLAIRKSLPAWQHLTRNWFAIRG